MLETPQTKKISVSSIRMELSNAIDEVYYLNTIYLLTKYNKVKAAIVPMDDFNLIAKLKNNPKLREFIEGASEDNMVAFKLALEAEIKKTTPSL